MRNFTETREKAIKRTRQLVCYFAEFMLEKEGGLTIMREKLHNLIDTIQEERLLRKIYFYILGLKGGRK